MRPFVMLTIAALMLLRQGRAQANDDSLAVAQARAAFKMISHAPDSGLAIAERLLLQSQGSGDKRLAAFAYKARGWAVLHKGSFDKSFPDLLLSTQLFQQLHETRELLMMYMNLSEAYSMRSQFVNSARWLLLADSLAQQMNDKRQRAEVQRQMAILYREQGQYRKAVFYFRESMDEYRALRDTVGFAGAASSLAIAYLSMSMADSSLVILRECSLWINALKGANYEKAMLNERFGDAYFATARLDKAFESYDRAYTIFTADNNGTDMAYEAMNLGKTLTKLKRYPAAETYLLLSYRINDSLKMDNYTPDAAGELAKFYQATGDWRKAYQWLEKQQVLQDSLQLKTQNEKTAQLQAQYEAGKKEQEISLLRKDKELNHALLQKQKAVQRGILAISVLLLLTGVLAVSRWRAIQKARRLIEIERMRNSIARDLHDDMGSALSSINIISKVALKSPDDPPMVMDQLRKIYEGSTGIMENMSDIVWAINPANDSLEKIIVKMKEFATDILEPLNILYTFEETGDPGNIRLALQERRDLYLIFKEAVNNSAKYSGCAQLTIVLAEKNREVRMAINDDGAGFDRADVRQGNGLRNMEERAKRMKAGLMISSSPGNGTSIVLTIGRGVSAGSRSHFWGMRSH